MAVVEQLNYTPSALARSLKVKETKTIGMLVTIYDNPFFAEVVASAERYCRQHHYHLIFAQIPMMTVFVCKKICKFDTQAGRWIALDVYG